MIETETRTCRIHGAVPHKFYKMGRRNGQRIWRCAACNREAIVEHKRRRKNALVQEAGGKCSQCGYDRCLRSLQFHHLDPSTKVFMLNSAECGPLSKFRTEAEKCLLVCANCHGEIEAGLITVAV